MKKKRLKLKKEVKEDLLILLFVMLASVIFTKIMIDRVDEIENNPNAWNDRHVQLIK